MKKTLPKILVIAVAVLLCSFFVLPQNADAGMETFTLTDRQDIGWGLGLGGFGTGWNTFNFQDVSMTVLTHPTRGAANAMFGGTMVHQSGQVFQFKTTLDNIRPTTPGTFPDNVPYDEMFDDMMNDGTLSLTWDSIKLEMSPETLIRGTAGYQGPLTWIGKPNAQGNPSLFKYERWEDGLFGASAWLRAVDRNGDIIAGTSGDFHFNADRNVVPEPGTMALLSLGLGGMGIVRKKREKKKV